MINQIKYGLGVFFANRLAKAFENAADNDQVTLKHLAEKTGMRNKFLTQYMRKFIDRKSPGSVMLIKFVKSSNGRVLLKRFVTNPNKRCRNKLLSNMIMNQFVMGTIKRQRMEKKGEVVPYLLVISPTNKCNLNCTGCYAGEYRKEEELTTKEVDNIIKQARELGIYFITISGGEPLVRKDLMKVYKKYNDVIFQIYTNGTSIDKKTANDFARLGNVIFAISVEGFKKETDKRRGKGTFEKVMKAMDYLKNEGVYFGFSVTATRENLKVFLKQEFINFYIKKGCYFGWVFQFIPVGKDPKPELMLTPKQRTILREYVHKIRDTKPIFVADFWNDGLYADGCMAAGRNYLHINSKGDVEPCVFVHFAVDNIKNKTLRQALNSDFFKGIRKKQPFGDNMLRPCMIIDHPNLLREFCKRFNAKPTHQGADLLIKDKKVMKQMNKYAQGFKKESEKPWKEHYSKCGEVHE